MTHGEMIDPRPTHVFRPTDTTAPDDWFLERLDALYARSLHPYENSTLLTERLSGQNRILRKSPELRALIVDSLRADDDESILAVVEWSEELRQEHTPPNQSAVNTLLSYLTFVNGVDTPRVRVGDVDEPVDRSNAICILVGQKLCESIPDEIIQDYVISAQFLSEGIKRLMDTNPAHQLKIQRSKLEVLRGMLSRRHRNIQYVDAIPSTIEYPSEDRVEADTQVVSELFADIQSSRHYGLKLGYIPHELGGSLIFSEPLELGDRYTQHKNVHPLTLRSRAVAEITHSAKQHFKSTSIKPVVAAKEGLDTLVTASYNHIDPVGIMTLGPDGELYVDHECKMPLRDTFTKQGKYHAYRELQADILALYFDLTHPAETVLQAKQAIASQLKPNQVNKKDATDVIRRLIIPRLQATQNDKPVKETHREVRIHGVVMHRRTLPEGWKASPEALRLAAEVGIQLEPGETLVRAFTRGSRKLGEVAAHKLVRRSSSI